MNTWDHFEREAKKKWAFSKVYLEIPKAIGKGFQQ